MRLKAALAILVAGLPALAAAAGRDYGAFYRDRFKEAKPRNDWDRFLLEEAQRVFDSVEAVADKKQGRLPRLLAVAKSGAPEAQALPDGNIVINLPLLRFCFAGGEAHRERGRARLAFVLGHEMAHLAHHDSWHAEAFAELRRLGGEGEWPRESREARQAHEFHADQVGFISMVRAGFTPQSVLGPRADIFKDWDAATEGGAGVLGARSRMLQASLVKLTETMPFFAFGVRLVQLGRFDDALPLLERARSNFPSREVESNLGLALYQRALARLRECGSDRATRFKLPVALDPKSLLVGVRLRGPDAPCEAERDLQAAESALTSAVGQDRAYVPALVNLVALRLVRGNPMKALSLLREEAPPEIRDADARLALLHAIARYLAGPKLGFDAADGALEELAQLETCCKEQAGVGGAATFARARIQQELRRPEARQAWEEFLSLEPQGPFADEARAALLRDGTDAGPPVPKMVDEPGRTPWDRLPVSVRKRMPSAARQRFSLGDVKGAFVALGSVRALELRGVVEMVEESLPAGTPPPERGAPLAVYEMEGGGRTLIYRDAAYDMEADRAVRRVLFRRR